MIDLSSSNAKPEKHSYEELSVQLLDAAIELSRFKRGQISECATVATTLANLGLRDRQFTTEKDLRKVVDPTTIDIYSRVISQLTSRSSRNIDELAAGIEEYSKFSGSQTSNEDLAKVKEFFLALHRELLAENYNRLEEDKPDRA